MIAEKKTSRSLRERWSTNKAIETRWCYIMLLLPIIGYLVFQIYPIIWTFRWSFFYYNQIPSQTRFVGFENFIRAFQDKNYWGPWITTVQFALMKVPVELTFAMIIALMISKMNKSFGSFCRSVYYFPCMIATVIAGLTFSNLFGYFGIANAWLTKLNAITEPIEWLTNSKWTAMTIAVVMSIWRSFGVNVLYFMSALTNVPKDLYESADLDGANGWQQFVHITMPSILPVFSVIILLSIIGTLGVNEEILVLTGGGPAGSTNTVQSYMYTSYVPGFKTGSDVTNLGYGSALGVITTIIYALIAVVKTSIDNLGKKD